MASERTPEQKLRSQVIRDMKSLRLYRKEYDRLINIYVDLLLQYEKAVEDFKKSGYQYETETAAGGTKKAGIVATIEKLRDDILKFSNELGITPAGLKKIRAETEVPKESKLTAAINNYNRQLKVVGDQDK